VATKTKPRTAVEYRRLVENIIVPAFGRKRVRDMTRSDVSRLHHEQRSAPYAANRTLAVLSKMLALAEKWGERPDGSNPCRHVEKFAEHKRERMLSAEEFRRLADALNASNRSPYALAAIKLLVFTGGRMSEILGLKWEWIRLVNLEKPWRSIRNAASLPDIRLHDLRHAFASVAASSGMGLPIIGKMLGHTQAATTHRYAHLASDPVKAAAATVAAKIADAMQDRSITASEIVPLKRTR
jgi:integrase